MTINKAVVEVIIRIVVSDLGMTDHNIDASIDNFLERATCSNIPIDLYPEGLVDVEHRETKIIHEWSE